MINNEVAVIQGFFTDQPLYTAMQQLHIPLYVLAPLHLKKSLGLIRGKTDQIDAVHIAQFVKRHYQELQPYVPSRSIIMQLQVLLTEQSQLIKIKKQLATSQAY